MMRTHGGGNGGRQSTAAGGDVRHRNAHRKERKDGHREPRQALLPPPHRLGGGALGLDPSIHPLLKRAELQHPRVLAQLPVRERRRQRRELQVPHTRARHVGSDLGPHQPLEPRVAGLACRGQAAASEYLERRTPLMSR